MPPCGVDSTLLIASCRIVSYGHQVLANVAERREVKGVLAELLGPHGQEVGGWRWCWGLCGTHALHWRVVLMMAHLLNARKVAVKSAKYYVRDGEELSFWELSIRVSSWREVRAWPGVVHCAGLHCTALHCTGLWHIHRFVPCDVPPQLYNRCPVRDQVLLGFKPALASAITTNPPDKAMKRKWSTEDTVVVMTTTEMAAMA